jgi:hypothetical protein
MSNLKKRIDLVADFQRISITQIREAKFTERNAADEVVFEVLLWSAYFDWILFSYPDYQSLHKESIVYRYCWSNLYGEETWGNDWAGEVEVDRLEEFYGHLKSIILPEDLNTEKELAAMIRICESAIQNKNKLFFIADYLSLRLKWMS